MRHTMAEAPAIASVIGLYIINLPFRHNPRLESVSINGVRHTHVMQHSVIGRILTPYLQMQTALDSTLRRLGCSLLDLAKANVPTLGQGFRIKNLLLQLNVSIPGVRIGNTINIYG